MGIKFDGNQILNTINFALEKNQIACLLGPSGCGKTSLLRAIAGFQSINQGNIKINGVTVADTKKMLPPEKRNIGMMFQDLALFPHLNIADNIGFGLRKLSKHDRNERITELLKLIGLAHRKHHYPHEISGGQQQRVALARALAPKPDVLLLDEPFSSMDIELREELAADVRKILKAENITAILVTHDQNEAFAMADVIGVIENGKIAQWDTAYQLYHEPKTLFIADFIGEGVFLEGVVQENQKIKTELAALEIDADENYETGSNVKVLIRPDDIVHDDCSPFTAKIVARNFRGSSYLYTLQLEQGTKLLSLVHSHHDHKIGEMLGITLDIDHLVVFPDS